MNKRYPLVILLIFAMFWLKAQPLPGQLVLNANSAFAGLFNKINYKQLDNSTQTKFTNITFQPSAGVFLSHYVNMGIYTSLNYQKSGTSESYNLTNAFGMGTYVKGYLNDKKLSPFLKGNLGYLWTYLEHKSDNRSSSESDRLKGPDLALGIGLEYFFNSSLSFECLVDYHYAFIYKFVGNSVYGIPFEDKVGIETKGIGFKFGLSMVIFKKKQPPVI